MVAPSIPASLSHFVMLSCASTLWSCLVMNPLPGDLFARRLRAERERLRLSQAEVARRMAALLGQNVEPTAITRIEQQTRAVRLDEAVAAAEALGVPLRVLLTENAARENELEIQELLADRALAEQNWEDARTEVERLSRALSTMTGERAELADYAAATDTESFELDSEFEENIQNRRPANVTPLPTTSPITDPVD